MSVADAGATRARPAGERALARHLHRGFFAAVGLLPRPISRWVRVRIFDGLFTSGTPWPYADSPFESIKRDHLLAQIPEGAHAIVEIGCADGHNVEALVLAHPDARVIGVDLSDRACALARERTANLANAEIVECDSATLAHTRPDLAGRVDVIVISEVLYYLGSGSRFAQQIQPLREWLAPGGCVIAVHTCDDAPVLHGRLAKVLNLTPTSENEVRVADRAFTISVLSR